MSRLYYDRPAGGKWEKAIPIGNGRLGAMVFGEADMEHYQINEESVWSGGPMERVNPDAKKNLAKVRELVFAGRIPEAERLLKFAFTGTPQSQRAYQTLGDMYVDLMGTVSEPRDYMRELDLTTAVHQVKVTDGRTGTSYVRECFATAADQAIVTHITSDRTGTVSVGAMVSRMCMYDSTWHEKDMVFFVGSTNRDGVDFCVGLKMCAEGDGVKIKALGEHLICENADSITVYLAAATSFRESDIRKNVRETLQKASAKSYHKVRQDHIREYRSYFDTCSLKLAYDTEQDKTATDERLRNISKTHPDNGLINTYFDFGRYLLISSSRPGTLPANLQGLWNNQLNPPWGSKFTININTQMNYWPAETLGLPECHMPLFEHLKKMEERGRKTAQEMYGCRGFVAHHNTDIWADTAPQDMYIPATYWVMGGAWLCTHIWEHYEFTRDRDFLKEMYGVIRSAVLFFMDYLVEHDGKYVTCPSVSPENTYILPDGTRGCICYGATMDNEILSDLFRICICAGEIVGEDELFLEQVRTYQEKIPKLKIGSEGQLLEWMEEYGEAEPGHRHISHLYALYPSSQIEMGRTPDLVQAAQVTLERRLKNGGGHTGWSRAWMIGMYARLWEADKAYDNLLLLFQKSTLENLLDTHPPFQIDGNFGSVAAIGEMLLQSNGTGHGKRRVVLLPALPAAWPDGKIIGICARGGSKYDICWKDGVLNEFVVEALQDYEAEAVYNGKEKNVLFHIKIRAGEKKTYCNTM